jgi:hypothetical protein
MFCAAIYRCYHIFFTVECKNSYSTLDVCNLQLLVGVNKCIDAINYIDLAYFPLLICKKLVYSGSVLARPPGFPANASWNCQICNFLIGGDFVAGGAYPVYQCRHTCHSTCAMFIGQNTEDFPGNVYLVNQLQCCIAIHDVLRDCVLYNIKLYPFIASFFV